MVVVSELTAADGIAEANRASKSRKSKRGAANGATVMPGEIFLFQLGKRHFFPYCWKGAPSPAAVSAVGEYYWGSFTSSVNLSLLFP